MPADDSHGHLDDDDYPAYTTGRPADMIGTTPGFLRALGEARLITPLRSEGGHRRYSRYQLRIAARARELVDHRRRAGSGARRHPARTASHRRSAVPPSAPHPPAVPRVRTLSRARRSRCAQVEGLGGCPGADGLGDISRIRDRSFPKWAGSRPGVRSSGKATRRGLRVRQAVPWQWLQGFPCGGPGEAWGSREESARPSSSPPAH